MPRRRSAAIQLRNAEVRNWRIIGTPWPDIAARFGISEATAKRLCWRVRPQVPMQPQRPPGARRLAALAAQQRRLEREQLAQQAHTLRVRGFSYRQIGARLGVPRNTAWLWAHDATMFRADGNGWPTPAGKPADWRAAIRARWADQSEPC